eukprot:393421-Prorocentrum_lima.AAC.1
MQLQYLDGVTLEPHTELLRSAMPAWNDRLSGRTGFVDVDGELSLRYLNGSYPGGPGAHILAHYPTMYDASVCSTATDARLM